MDDCIFCKIAAGQIPSKKVYEDERVLAFWDINPQAKVHFLVIPKKHVLSSADDVTDENCAVIGQLYAAIAKAAREVGLRDGYRVINNCGKHGCQSVPHFHLHVVGGEQMLENPILFAKPSR